MAPSSAVTVRDGDPMGVTGEIAQDLLGPANGALQQTTHLMRRSGAMNRLNFLLSASPAWVLKNVSWLASCA